MSERIGELVKELARIYSIDLAPDWIDQATGDTGEDRDAVSRLATSLGWDQPQPVRGKPRAHAFPMLVHSPTAGWWIAEQWETGDTFRVRGLGQEAVLPFSGDLSFFQVRFPDPLRGGRRLSAISIFRDALLQRKDLFVAGMIATLLSNTIALVTSLFSMQVYDRVIPRASFSTLIVLVIGVAVALLIDLALRITRALLVEREAQKIDAETSEFFFARAQSVRLDARSMGVGTMASQLRGLEQVRSVMSASSLFLIADLPFAALFVLVIFWLGGPLAIVPLISFPLALLLAVILARGIRRSTDRAQISGNRKNGLLVESLDSAETVKANRGGWYMLGRWNRLLHEVHAHEYPVKRWSAVSSSVFTTLQQMTYVVLIAFGAVEVAGGRMTTGALVACAIITGRVNGPLIAQLPNFIIQWGYARSSLKQLDGILDLPQDHPAETANLRPDNLDGQLRLERVSFVYPGAKDGLEIERLRIDPGERVGVIGGIGSGKSTLLRILAGLYAPQQGSVTINGLDMTQIADDLLRQHVGYLPQEFRLINGSLRDNILLGLPDPGDKVLLDAAATTGLSHLIARHPWGLDLPISEGGRGLSGGQRTLTGLTRLLLSDPGLWLLDEPTANLDAGTEKTVLAAIQAKMRKDSTFVMVTHKMSLLNLVNRVVVLAGGRVTIDGPTAEVLKRLQTSGVAQIKRAGAPADIRGAA
ncbi:MAG TPA: ATP-binding cassette domain-containing protein [Sphingomonas sp.]|nr:ATP-binding cassette domain-containing protein [Sphingomonas sp.]